MLLGDPLVLLYLLLLAAGLRFFLFDFISLRGIRRFVFRKLFRGSWLGVKFFSCQFCQGFWCGLFVYLLFNLDLIYMSYVEMSVGWFVILYNVLGFTVASGFLNLLISIFYYPRIEEFEYVNNYFRKVDLELSE